MNNKKRLTNKLPKVVPELGTDITAQIFGDFQDSADALEDLTPLKERLFDEEDNEVSQALT